MTDLVKERVKVIINSEKRDLEFERQIRDFFTIYFKMYNHVGTDWTNPKETILYFSRD